MQKRSRRVRYAVVGQGYISQIAVLPAFTHARQVAELAALVSDDRSKATRLARRYRVPDVFGYEEYEECLHSGIDAVYIALPNSMHAEYAIRAARAGVHVLCEKPMAPSTLECAAMVDTARESGVKLMIAYRLHFEAGTLRAIDVVRSGRLGEPRVFTSTFCNVVGDRENIRLSSALGGGTLPDIGIYCINAARALFGDEPIEVFAAEAAGADHRFDQVAEGTSCMMRFPGERLATFTCSFGAADTSSYQIVGTDGDLVVSPAYDFAGPIIHRLTIDGETKTTTFPRRDQFAPELLHFSECILEDREPGPSGSEGLADVRVIEALQESARIGRPVPLAPFDVPHRPDLSQEIHRPPVAPPRLYHAVPPRGSN
jgi:glucose-fructose oxidoreductase